MFGGFTSSQIVQSLLSSISCLNVFLHAVLSLYQFSIFFYYASFLISTAFDLLFTSLHLIYRLFWCVCLLLISSVFSPFLYPNSTHLSYLLLLKKYIYGWVALKYYRNNLLLRYLEGKKPQQTFILMNMFL